MMSDTDLLNWLQDEQVDTIYLDDGRIIDVKSGDLRAKISSAYEKQQEREDSMSEQCREGDCSDCLEDGQCGCHCHPGAKEWDRIETGATFDELFTEAFKK